MKTKEQELKDIIKKLEKVTEYKKPIHSFTYNELHQRQVGVLEGYQQAKKEFLEMIGELQNKWRDDIEPIYEQLEELKQKLEVGK